MESDNGVMNKIEDVLSQLGPCDMQEGVGDPLDDFLKKVVLHPDKIQVAIIKISDDV